MILSDINTSGRRLAYRRGVILFLTVLITLLHYFTPLHLPYLHDIFQRLYYLPIILSAVWFGLRGGLLSAVTVSILYAPHLLLQWGGHIAMEMEKYLEIVLYNIVGAMTGLLSQKEQERTAALQLSEENLKKAYQESLHQSRRISMIEEQLRDTERLSSIGEMSAVLAHEIRNPLASIRGSAEILQSAFKPDDRLYEFLNIQIKETERLDNVVQDFLRFARPLAIRKEPCNIIDELKTIIAMVSYEKGGKQSVIELDSEELPLISADGQKLRQAFLNLIQNARDASGAEGLVKITVRYENTNNEKQIVVHIDDNGSGISSDAADKLFEPFFTTKVDGTGLGLPTTKKIIEGHGGSLKTGVSTLGGARFTTIIPADSEEALSGEV